MGIDKYLNLTYKLVSSDNFDAFLEAMHVDEGLRKKIVTSTPTLIVTEDGGAYTMKYSSSVHNHTTSFTPGVEYEDAGVDGKIYKCVTTIDGNIITTKVLSQPVSVVVSNFADDKLTVTFTAGSVTGVRIFEAV